MRRRGVERHLLVQEAQVGGPDDTAGVGLVHPGEQPQQGGLPGAVLTDQADPGDRGRGERDAVEHPPGAERADEIMGEQSRRGAACGAPPRDRTCGHGQVDQSVR